MLKKGINFLKEDIYCIDDTDNILFEVENKLSSLTAEIFEAGLNKDSN